MMNIRIEKRVPFGFKGHWGKCYKLINYNDISLNKAITYRRSNYFDMGFDIQFKYLEDGVDKSLIKSLQTQNIVVNGEYLILKTTDAYFDGYKYCSVIQPSDIIFFEHEFWNVEKIDERSIFNPSKQSFYYVSLKKIKEQILIGEN